MSEQSHDWKVPPVAHAYDGRPLAEFDDPMELSAERVRVRFGGQIPRDVSLALNDAYRRGRKDGRGEALRDAARALATLPLAAPVEDGEPAMSTTMVCNHCGGSIKGTVAEVIEWNKGHDAQCPAQGSPVADLLEGS